MELSTTPTFLDNVATGLSTSTASYTSFVHKSAGIRFSWYDYLIFCFLILISLGIGIYFGCFGKKQNVKDYLLAGGNMKVFPVVVSLVASHTSGITLLALPAEVYSFGANYWLCAICLYIVPVITVYVFLPVFYKLQLTSTYEYLGIRFDKKTRKLASVLFTISVFCLVPIATYIPAMAFSSATGLDLHKIIPVICGTCIFYTAIGGLKALVWSDTLQFSATLGALLTILGLGLYKVGGIGKVMMLAYSTNRLDLFDFALDFTKRDSFWTIVIGFSFHWIAVMSINQGCMQKFLAVGTFRESKWVVFLYCSVGMIAVKSISILSGLTMYTHYADCDPLKSNKIRHNNEIFPYFVLDVAGQIPGLSGLFIAGVFCASLSALSCNLNSLAGTIYEDFIKPKLSTKNQENAGYFLKGLVVIIGIIGTALVYIVEHLGGLLSLSVGLGGIAQGPLLGLFTLGVLFPRANAKGAFCGALASIVTVTGLVFGAYYLKSQHIIVPEYKTTSIAGCLNGTDSILDNLMGNSTKIEHIETPAALVIFKISFYWYAFIGTMICIVLGLVISYLSEEQSPPIARELLCPLIYDIIDEKYVDKMILDYEQVSMDLEGKHAGGRRMSRWEENRQERLRKASYVSGQFEC
ncbi:unnamed protein product [Diabrotica balteata]|uniref:Sodium-coupled monocarboxylate transporter 1 n=1 Tax=Diabrotica balteata TaxID=107213 RepID=A0A9N9XAH6_DIABA|nr:unnamed protein product [Diabrotica balteata]